MRLNLLNSQTQKRKRMPQDAALSVIILTVSNKFIDYIRFWKTAKKAWDTLESLHQDYGLMQQIEFLEDLTTLRKGDMSVSDYVAKLMDLNRKVMKTGIKFGQHTLALLLLRGIPKDKYEVFIRSLELKDKLNLDNVIAMVLIEEKRQKRDEEAELKQDEAKALAAFQRSGTKKKKQFKSKPVSKEEITETKTKQQHTINEGRIYKCFTSSKFGHVAKNCPGVKEFLKTKEGNKDPASGAAKSAVSNLIDIYTSGRAYCSVGRKNYLKQQLWYLDSCCSDHMSPIKEDFVDLDESVRGTITMGNGDTAEIAGRGVVKVTTSDGDGAGLV